MARSDFTQINLKLNPELLSKIDSAVATSGNVNRSDWLRATITAACEGRNSQGVTPIDQPARDALVVLRYRLDVLEEKYSATDAELTDIKRTRTVGQFL